MAYSRLAKTNHKLIPSKNKYKFRSDKQPSLVAIKIKIPILKSRLISLEVDLVRADVSFLIGLDFLDKYNCSVNSVENKLCCSELILKIPLTRKKRHIYLEWNEEEEILITPQELINIHIGFSHPTSDKFYNLLKIARP